MHLVLFLKRAFRHVRRPEDVDRHAALVAQVSVRILGGLMALGYQIGTVMKRESKVYTDDNIIIKFDAIENMPHQYIQVTPSKRLFP